MKREALLHMESFHSHASYIWKRLGQTNPHIELLPHGWKVDFIFFCTLYVKMSHLMHEIYAKMLHCHLIMLMSTVFLLKFITGYTLQTTAFAIAHQHVCTVVHTHTHPHTTDSVLANNQCATLLLSDTNIDDDFFFFVIYLKYGHGLIQAISQIDIFYLHWRRIVGRI